MAVLTDVGRIDMRRRLARRVDPVMAAETVADDGRVIERSRHPGVGGVAVVACVSAGDVSWMLADGNRAVMAGAACADDLCVVHRVGGRPLHPVVAVLANVTRVDMRCGLARGIDAVVAACAVARNVRMVERRRYPAIGRVAVVTGVATREMPGMLAGGYGAVVAGRAGTEHLRVVYTIGRRPLHRGMTVFAHVARRHVRRPLAGRVNAIVATEAITRDIRMIEGGRYPAIRRVAVVAGIATCDMSRVFAGCDGAVMA